MTGAAGGGGLTHRMQTALFQPVQRYLNFHNQDAYILEIT